LERARRAVSATTSAVAHLPLAVLSANALHFFIQAEAAATLEVGVAKYLFPTRLAQEAIAASYPAVCSEVAQEV